MKALNFFYLEGSFEKSFNATFITLIPKKKGGGEGKYERLQADKSSKEYL